MQLTCPHCQFSKEVPAARLPATQTSVTCPQCQGVFPFVTPAFEVAAAPRVTCPACQQEQARADSCSGCGLIFARYRPAAAPPQASPQVLPKAGFWLRLVALMIDVTLVFLLQLVFGVLLMLASGNGFQLQGAMSWLLQLFSTVLSLFYWIFFTGHCGQTPGKMLLRIKVIVTDGSSLSYGKAFYREVVGKFLSGIILCIGYLMAAFDDQKQGLHDRMAKTYVIKL